MILINHYPLSKRHDHLPQSLKVGSPKPRNWIPTSRSVPRRIRNRFDTLDRLPALQVGPIATLRATFGNIMQSCLASKV